MPDRYSGPYWPWFTDYDPKTVQPYYTRQPNRSIHRVTICPTPLTSACLRLVKKTDGASIDTSGRRCDIVVQGTLCIDDDRRVQPMKPEQHLGRSFAIARRGFALCCALTTAVAFLVLALVGREQTGVTHRRLHSSTADSVAESALLAHVFVGVVFNWNVEKLVHLQAVRASWSVCICFHQGVLSWQDWQPLEFDVTRKNLFLLVCVQAILAILQWQTRVHLCVITNQPDELQGVFSRWALPDVHVCRYSDALEEQKYALLWKHREVFGEAVRSGAAL